MSSSTNPKLHHTSHSSVLTVHLNPLILSQSIESNLLTHLSRDSLARVAPLEI